MKLQLPDSILDKISGGHLLLGDKFISDVDVTDKGVTVTTDGGDKYFRGWSKQEQKQFKTIGDSVREAYESSLTDMFPHTLEVSEFKKI